MMRSAREYPSAVAPLATAASSSARHDPLRAAGCLAVLIPATLAMGALVCLAAPLLRDPGRRIRHGTFWTRCWARLFRALVGVDLHVEGPLPPAGALLVPNHQGYLDIALLAAVLPCCFVPKAELAAWPVLGRIMREAGHVYVDRRRGRALAATTDAVAQRLRAGIVVCAFLEGTSTGGDRLLPFKPALLEPALRCGAPLVPVAIRYHATDPRIDLAQDVAYWTPEHTIGPHLWRLLGLRGLQATITFASPLIPVPDEPRRALAQRLQGEVAHLSSLPQLDA